MDLHLDLLREASLELESLNIDVEIIDVQTLIPFDLTNSIKESLKEN